MKRLILIAVLLFYPCGVLCAQSAQPDVRTFEIKPSAPPVPALKYQLIFDDLGDRRPGNAAILYLQSILLMGPDAQGKAGKALDAHDAHDANSFDSLAGALEMTPLFQELDLAARREDCDWQPPFREVGAYTLLPHLSPLVHGIAPIIKVRALREIEQGKADQAIKTLRLGYELSNKMGREPELLSGLVSLAVTRQMNDALAQLMSRPECPNLYWALAELPDRRSILRHALDGERAWAVPSIPHLTEARAGQQLTAAEWQGILEYVWGIANVSGEPGDQHAKRPDPVKGTSPELLQQARTQYAQRHHLSADQANRIEPVIVIGSFYLQEYETWFDEQFKLRGLPYPQWLAMAKVHASQVEKLEKEQPANPFGMWGAARAVWKFAAVDRQLAALTAVEALRSYAAANNGALPKRLEDVTATPVPVNPVSGKAFEYRAEGESAVLSDSQSQDPLTYTVKVRK